MTYLVDANVLSEPTKPVPNNKVIDWLTANEGNLVVDSIVVGELYVGILALPRGRKRTTRAMIWQRGANHRLPSMGRHDQPTVG
jgi:toxin FitB